MIQTIWQGFLNLPHFFIITILAILITLLTTIIYKYTTDQKRLKEIKTKLKELRAEQKKHKTNQKKLMNLQKEMMELNMEMMKQSFKSMLYTFLPLILLFSWMAANIAYEPIQPGQEFTITAQISNSYIQDLKEINITILPNAEITLNEKHTPSKENRREIQWIAKVNEEGTYTATIESPTFKESHTILITNTNKYTNPIKDIKGSQLLKITTGNKPVRPLETIGLKLNWLWTYIIISIIASILLRKLLKVS